MSVDEAARVPVRTALSGPSAGVAGAAWIAGRAGFDAIATFDMGGTSTDVAFVRDGRPALSFEREIGGVTLRVPALDIHTVGAGGGSIAWRDSGGALKVGPHSAGAEPGPACYGRGGEEPTVTDANLVLGRLGVSGLAGGSVPLDPARAEAAVSRLARELGLGLVETARGIVRVVNANMANAVRVVTVQRGVDPTGLTLVPVRRRRAAARRRDGARPGHSGHRGAAGAGAPLRPRPPRRGPADGRRAHAPGAARGRRASPRSPRASRTWRPTCWRWLDRERVAPDRRRMERWLDLRYVGQNFELLVPVPEETWATGDCAALYRRFLEAHEQVYGFAAEDEPVQVVNARVVARGLADPPRLAAAGARRRRPRARPRWSPPRVRGRGRGVVTCPVYDRARLRAGQRIDGPAVVEQFDATTLLLAGQAARVDDLGFLVIEAAR